MTQAASLAKDAALMEQALRMIPGFVPWSAEAMNRLLSRSHVGRYSRGEVLVSPSDPAQILAILSGHVVAGYTPPGGTRSAFALAGPGGVVGFVRLSDDANSAAYDFTAHDKVVAVHMPRSLALEILDGEPVLWKSMMKMLLRQNRETMDAMVAHLVGSLQQRLAVTIERLSKLYGQKVSGTSRRQLRLTQEDLAAILQAARQSVNRELKSLAASGVISLEYNAITVLDPSALRGIAHEAAGKDLR
jgi:CRP-like cAMP-binding protein